MLFLDNNDFMIYVKNIVSIYYEEGGSYVEYELVLSETLAVEWREYTTFINSSLSSFISWL